MPISQRNSQSNSQSDSQKNSQKASQKVLGVVGLTLMAAGIQGRPAIAQTISISDLGITDTSVSESIINGESANTNDLLANDVATSDMAVDTQEIGLTLNESVSQTVLQPEAELVNSQPAFQPAFKPMPKRAATLSTLIAPATVAPATEMAPAVEDSLEFQAVQPVTEAAALVYPNVYSTHEEFDETVASDATDVEINAELAYPVTEEPIDLAQARRRTRGTALGSDYIGIGADIGYADDFGFAAISKFSLTRRIAIRPSVVIGDDFAVLVPITYDFTQYSSDVGGFPVRPYAGVGASYTDRDDDDDNNTTDDDDSSDINLLLSAGVDIPVSRRFTLNGQVNWGVLEESQFGVTVGVGYNFGNIFGR